MSRRLWAPENCANSNVSSRSLVPNRRTPASAPVCAIRRSSAAHGNWLVNWRNTVFWCGTARVPLMSDSSGNASDREESTPCTMSTKFQPDSRGLEPAIGVLHELIAASRKTLGLLAHNLVSPLHQGH